jgi:hypothetical protein
MINVKAKPQGTLKTQRVQQKTTFQVLSRVTRGSTGVITVDLPSAGKISASGTEIKGVRATAHRPGRTTLEVDLKGRAATAVRRHGRIRAHIRLSYIPRGGLAVTKTVPLIFGYK